MSHPELLEWPFKTLFLSLEVRMRFNKALHNKASHNESETILLVLFWNQ